MQPNTLKQELKRVQRTTQGTELQEAKARSKRLLFAEMGISSTNLIFDSDLAHTELYKHADVDEVHNAEGGIIHTGDAAREYLTDEILKVLKDDPERDTGIMYTRVPTDAQTSTIGESSQGNRTRLDTDQDDDDQHSFIKGFELNDLDHIQSGSQRVINRLPYFIHDLKRWSTGFDVIKYKRAMHLLAKESLAQAMGDEMVTARGTLRQRRPKAVSSVTKRVARKRGVNRGLQS